MNNSETNKSVRTPFLYLLGVSVALVCIGLFISHSSQFALKKTQVDGRTLGSKEMQTLGLIPGRNLFDQNLELVAKVMCRRSGIGSATVKCETPNTVRVITNRYRPAYAVYDRSGKCLRAITSSGMVVPLDSVTERLSGPTLIGLTKITELEKPDDFRLMNVVSVLQKIRDESEDWYRQISAIDFSYENHLVVCFDSYEFLALAQTMTLEKALNTLETLLCASESQRNEISQAALVDLRYDGLVYLTTKNNQQIRFNTAG